ncbi:diguanylate cyclase (GGDEF)-like protein/PAS domain S-box-containing protein [Desulfobaculum xiamenense]|uniref:Diguanylate cyclase (GGDEF)-like protein/PAS domain S-box-containing protein n=1 Tax=Desulfobaculum xiamenense TaxID=995050 RepID=A0A846QQQ9_9BACT|nr:EAL domain-containing protein [Desulfobaculum xiamenense]NJB69320.1 diguanylate cyclase (GGDEF)-like protein/PAS domain S-box-containing protein [Desulfobaculum xiamenense]
MRHRDSTLRQILLGRGFRRRIAYAAIIAILCAGLACALVYANILATRSQRAAYTTQLSQQAATIRETIASRLGTIATATQVFASDLLPRFEKGRMPETGARANLARLSMIFPAIRAVSYTRLHDGALLLHAAEGFDTPALRSLVGAEAAHLPADTRLSPGTRLGDTMVMALTVPVRADSELTGILCCVIDCSRLAFETSPLNDPKQHRFCTVIDGQGTIIDCFIDALCGTNLMEPTSAMPPHIRELTRRVVKIPNGSDVFDLPKGVSHHSPARLLAWDSLALGGQRIVVACTAPESIAAIPLTRQRVLYAGIGAMLLTALAILVIIGTARRTRHFRRAAYRRMLEVIDVVPDPTFAVDTRGTVIAWNPAMAALTGIPSEEILGRGEGEHARLFHGERRPMLVDLIGHGPREVERLYDTVERVGDVVQVETFVPSLRNGRGAHVAGTASLLRDDDGAVIGAIETVRDVTRLKRAERRLRASEERYALAVAGANDCIWDLNLRTDSLYVSTRWADILGIPPSQAPTGLDDWHARLHPADSPAVTEAFESVIRGEMTHFDIEYRMRHQDGSYRWVLTRGAGLKDIDGTVCRITGALTDITERKHEEAISSILLAISGAVHASRDLNELYATVHSILLRHIDATNFYIATVDRHRACLDFPYFRDEREGTSAESIPLDEADSPGLTMEIIRNGCPRFLDRAGIDAIGGIGPQAQQWLGTPLVIADTVMGAMAVQHYADPHHYTRRDLDLLVSVSAQVAMAIERKMNEEELSHQARHDALTGLANRALFTERLEQAIARARRRENYRFAVLMLDLDDFKLVNDCHGHQTGDALLLHLAGTLPRMLRATDTMARLGGDEFAVLIEEFNQPREVVRIIRRLQEATGEPVALSGEEVLPSTSIGVVINGRDYADTQSIMRDADIAMYQAKQRGKGRFRVFSSSMRAQATQQLDLRNSLSRAVRNGEFTLVYQPIFRAWDQALVGFEALLRWRHPLRGFVSPAEFIPVAEETALILPIGRFALEEACAAMARWRAAHPCCRDLTMGVNLSARQTVQTNLTNIVRRTLGKTALPPSCLKLEITETAVMEAPTVSQANLRKLRGLGVSLAIDDFGIGHSSLAYISNLPVQTVKIDHTFTSRLGRDVETREVIRAIITLAHSVGLNVVAEGVEDESQLAMLRGLGCEYIQGFLLGRPMPEDDITALLRSLDDAIAHDA